MMVPTEMPGGLLSVPGLCYTPMVCVLYLVCVLYPWSGGLVWSGLVCIKHLARCTRQLKTDGSSKGRCTLQHMKKMDIIYIDSIGFTHIGTFVMYSIVVG